MNTRPAIDEFDPSPPAAYRSLCGLAVASLVCGLLSSAVVVEWTLGLIPAAGIVLGGLALRRIHRAPEEYSGAGWAWSGIALAAAFWLAGGAWAWYEQAQEVPHGYIGVSYSDLRPDPEKPGEPIPARALELDGKRVFVRGYMYPGRQQTRIKQFIISRDNGSCQFCMPNPAPTDLIHVSLGGDLETDYTTRLLRIGGVLRIRSEALSQGPGAIVYRLEADYLR